MKGKNVLQELCRQAGAKRDHGRYSMAESAYIQALDLAGKLYGPDSLAAAGVANNLAVAYKYMGRFHDAAILYLRAIRIIRKRLGATHPEMASIYHNLGGLEHA